MPTPIGEIERAFREGSGRAVATLARQLGDLSLAEEVVQDAFEKTLRAWTRVRQPGAYLRQAVVNGCRSELRRRRVTRRVPQWREQPVASPETPLLDALQALTPKRRIAVTLRYYADLPEAEIAELMGVRVGTVKSLVSRGLADLRKVIAR